MEVTKKLQKLSLAALTVSLLPLFTLVPVFLKATLPDGVRTVWAVCNIVLVLSGLVRCLSDFWAGKSFPGQVHAGAPLRGGRGYADGVGPCRSGCVGAVL